MRKILYISLALLAASCIADRRAVRTEGSTQQTDSVAEHTIVQQESANDSIHEAVIRWHDSTVVTRVTVFDTLGRPVSITERMNFNTDLWRQDIERWYSSFNILNDDQRISFRHQSRDTVYVNEQTERGTHVGSSEVLGLVILILLAGVVWMFHPKTN